MIFLNKNKIDDVFTYLEFYDVILCEFGGRVDFMEFGIVKSIDFTGFIDCFMCDYALYFCCDLS